MKDPSDFKGSTDLYGKIESEATGLGRFLSKIPGFDGYMERSRRREADQLLRSHISHEVEGLRLRLGSVQETLARDISQAIAFAEPLGRADVCLRGLAGKIKDAPTGYAGFFDAVKIQEEELARLYEFDESILAHVDRIDAALRELEEAVLAGGDLDGLIAQLQMTCRETNQLFDRRYELLTGLSD